VALFGGGWVVMQITIPDVGRPARIISGCLAPVFILLALVIAGVIPSPWTARPPEDVTFVVNAALGTDENAGEIETEMVISLAGKEAAKLSLDANSPAKSNSVTVPKPGYYLYSITGYTRWTTDRGRRVPLGGSGKIDIQKERSYTVRLESVPSSTTQECKAYLRRAD
jgi:hypothetical protein